MLTLIADDILTRESRRQHIARTEAASIAAFGLQSLLMLVDIIDQSAQSSDLAPSWFSLSL